MRFFVLSASLALAVALGCLASPSASAQDARACSFEGVWQASNAGFTTRIEASTRWSTWSGLQEVPEGAPAIGGWLEVTPDRLIFGDERGRGYGYQWRFEDRCSVLRLSGPAQIVFVRVEPVRTRSRSRALEAMGGADHHPIGYASPTLQRARVEHAPRR